MIRSWANVASRRFFETGKSSKFRGMESEVAQELLAALDAATALSDLSPLKSVGLHKLKGDRKGQWAMTVNGPGRLPDRGLQSGPSSLSSPQIKR